MSGVYRNLLVPSRRESSLCCGEKMKIGHFSLSGPESFRLLSRGYTWMDDCRILTAARARRVIDLISKRSVRA